MPSSPERCRRTVSPEAASGIRSVDLIGAEIAAVLSRHPPTQPLIVGVCGSQGSGKTTVCRALAARFRQSGISVADLSLDDLYLPLADRVQLSQQVHPLLHTRGVPGTHDTELGLATFDALGRAGRVQLPRFDKATDDRHPVQLWDSVEAPARLVLFEGWCVGARAQSSAALAQPVNELEANEDPDGRWRRYVNDALAGAYQQLFARIGFLVLLAAPSFDVVLSWRLQQEHELREQALTAAGEHSRVMSDAAVARFIQHYERLTRYILDEMPARADVVIRLAADRSVLSSHRPQEH